jgi:hypothetical protein
MSGILHGMLLASYGGIVKATSFLGNLNATSGSTATFTSAVSSVAYSRYILCLAGGVASGAGTFSSATIAGVAATPLGSDVTSTNTTARAFIAAIPGGTSGDIVVNWTGSKEATYLAYYEITGISSTTPIGTGGTTTGNSGQAITTVAGGFLYGFACANSTFTCTWTNITEDFDFTGGTGNHSSSGAHIATTGSSVTATANPTSSTQLAVIYVSY